MLLGIILRGLAMARRRGREARAKKEKILCAETSRSVQGKSRGPSIFRIFTLRRSDAVASQGSRSWSRGTNKSRPSTRNFVRTKNDFDRWSVFVPLRLRTNGTSFFRMNLKKH